MRRELQAAALCVGVANAMHFPAPFLQPRQNVPTGTGDLVTTAVTAGATTTATSSQPPSSTLTSTSPPTTVVTTTVPTTTLPTPTAPQTTVTTSDTAAQTTTTTQIPTSSVTTTQTPTPTTTRPTTSQAPTTTEAATTAQTTAAQTTTQAPEQTTVLTTDLPTSPPPVTTITFTSDGQLASITATGTHTHIPTSTSKPGLASGYGSSNNMLSGQSKRLIGGIVGGLGGVLLLVGIGFVAYRIWGRKKRQALGQEDDLWATGGVGVGGAGASASDDSIVKQKSGWGRTGLTSKFSEPLERYRNHSGGAPTASQGYKSPSSVNAASNF